ncbi:hypothetical protein HDV00_008207 [Rhizophlyctis rosea]|nr:hypothetical protein HDV00_008207 [Rhizophlyctis rosea]
MPSVTPAANAAAVLKQRVRSNQNVPFSRVWRGVVAEFIGTAFFVYFASASVTVPFTIFHADQASSVIVAALTQGFAITALVAINGKISVGGTLGSTVRSFPTAGQTFLMEFMITSMLMFTVLGTALHSDADFKPLAPIPIGFSVTAGVLIAGLVTGGSMNPARSFGPAVISGTWTQHWIYWVAPFLSAFVVGILYKLLFLSAPLTIEEAKGLGLNKEQSVTDGMGTGSDRNVNMSGPNYITAAEAIDMKAADMEEIVVDGPANGNRSIRNQASDETLV